MLCGPIARKTCIFSACVPFSFRKKSASLFSQIKLQTTLYICTAPLVPTQQQLISGVFLQFRQIAQPIRAPPAFPFHRTAEEGLHNGKVGRLLPHSKGRLAGIFQKFNLRCDSDVTGTG